MITAYGDAETKRKALEGGAEALFTEPIDFGALRSEIDARVAQNTRLESSDFECPQLIQCGLLGDVLD